MATDKEQPVTAGKAEMGTVEEQWKSQNPSQTYDTRLAQALMEG